MADERPVRIAWSPRGNRAQVRLLLDVVQPDNLYMGQKDYQQCMVISRLVELMRPEPSININICPTLREADGLAMSSRNMRLNEKERDTATLISQCLFEIKNKLPGTESFGNNSILLL